MKAVVALVSRRVVTGGLAVALGVAALATGRLFVWPAGDSLEDVRGVDAVVMFVGGRGERLETALQVVDAAGAPNLVVPNGTVPEWPHANALCTQPQDFAVWCPTPDPDTTRGEARTIASLAAREGWARLALVTSDYHTSRARLLLERCFDGEVDVVVASSGLGLLERGVRVTHEWLGFARAQLIDRGC